MEEEKKEDNKSGLSDVVDIEKNGLGKSNAKGDVKSKGDTVTDNKLLIARAISKRVDIGPKKLNALAREIRRKVKSRSSRNKMPMKYDFALQMLRNTNSKSAGIILKTIKSTFSNLQSKNKEVLEEEVFVKTIRVDKALGFKRTKPRARGRADRYVKHHSHLLIELAVIDNR